MLEFSLLWLAGSLVFFGYLIVYPQAPHFAAKDLAAETALKRQARLAYYWTLEHPEQTAENPLCSRLKSSKYGRRRMAPHS